MKYILYLLTAILIFSSCEKVLENTEDLSDVDDNDVWGDSVLARYYVDYVYDQNLPTYPSGDFYKLNEELYTSNSFYLTGSIDPSNTSYTPTTFGTSISTTNTWGKLRQINNFIQQIDNGGLSYSYRKLLKGQVYFFRAWRYFELVNLYGGVPLILTAQNAVTGSDEELFPKRNSTSECINQICKDLDSAINMLPGVYASTTSDWGRITKGAAMAFKGKVLMYWASPQFCPDNTSSAWTERWQAAYNANKAAIDTLVEYGYGLNSNYQNMFFDEISNPEAVFVTCYNSNTSSTGSKTNAWALSCIPKDWGGSSGNLPTMNIVNAYPMLDGKSKDDGSSSYTYDANYFFKNRDPRLQASIAYNGATWTIGNTAKRLWTYYTGSTSTETNPTTTGFYCRKMVTSSISVANLTNCGTNWMEIRYAEVLLNLAECACRIGRISQSEEAYQGLISVRKRAGIDAGTDGLYGLTSGMDEDALFEAILFERQIEFAFEGKRFWDLRRNRLMDRMVGFIPSILKETYNSANPEGITSANFQSNLDKLVMNTNYSDFFTYSNSNLSTVPAVSWYDSYYFFPLPTAAISNNPNLEQNVDWGGTFDPLL